MGMQSKLAEKSMIRRELNTSVSVCKLLLLLHFELLVQPVLLLDLEMFSLELGV